MSRTCLTAILAALSCTAFGHRPPSIVLESHFTYIVLGGDHVAESVGKYLATRDTNKTVLVLKGSRCNDVLEPSEPSKLWLEVSYLFAESAHYLGYEFVDPFLHGSKPGIAFTNQSSGFIQPLQQLYAVDPNLKMLTDARPQRIIYNKASSTALGVEVTINFETQYIFAKEELIVAGRCLEDYQLISQADVLSNDVMARVLREIPLEIALKSPIVAPIFSFNARSVVDHPPTKQPYCLLATELFIETLSKGGDGHGNTKNGIQPNAKINIIIKEQAPDRWVGFNPSVIYQESATELADPATLLTVLTDTIEVCKRLGASETFQKLGLSLQRNSSADSYPPDPTDSVVCFVNQTLSSVFNNGEDSACDAYLLDMKHLANDFRLKGSRNLRLLPFGLTSPFLEPWWRQIFTRRKVATEYTTRTGILSPNLHQLGRLSVDTLLNKLNERLKVLGNIPRGQ